MLSEEAIDRYLEPLTEEQRDSIRGVRALIIERCPTLVEEIDQGKWFGGLLTYKLPGGLFAYALGPRGKGATTFHMMPYYRSIALQQRHGAALKRFLTGKSCIRFERFSDVPEGALCDILAATGKMQEAVEQAWARPKRKDR